MRRFKTLVWVLLAVVVGGAWIAMHPGNVSASPAAPGIVETVFQPDGTPIRATLWGDEFANGLETLDGYTILVNPVDHYWAYAVLDASGVLMASAQRVGRDAPTARTHLRPTEAAVETARRAMGAPPMGEPYLQAPPPWAGADTHVVMLMVQFSDVSFSYSRDDLAAAMFGAGASGPGNLADYFSQVSGGMLGLNGTVAGPVTAAHTKAYYDTASDGARVLVREVVGLADPTVDFSLYDNDDNGVVDDLILVYAGGGVLDGCYPLTTQAELWPHSWSLSPAATTGDGVSVAPYILNSGTTYGLNDGVCDDIQTVGLIVHEFGHAMGLPDLYDTGSTSRSEGGVGNWSPMASQWLSTVNKADTPAFYDAWSRSFEGWVTPSESVGSHTGVSLPQAETSPTSIRLLANPGGVQVGGSGEYFLLENRQKVGFDSQLPGCGTLIWHIDETQTTNRLEGHRLVQLEQADGLASMDVVPQNNNRGDAGDPYPGSTVNRLFDDTTSPSAHLNSGSASGVSVGVPGNCAATMTLNLTASVVNDFSIDANPASRTVAPGSSTTYTTSTAIVSGSPETVALSVTAGLPAGATASFDPASVTTGGSSTLTVSTTAATPIDTSTLTIQGTSPSATHSTTVQLVVGISICPPDDAFEPNDTRATAAALTSGLAIAGIACNDDYFAMSAVAGDTLTADLAFTDANGDLDMRLYGPDGTEVGISQGVEDTEQIVYEVTESGTYYVLVYGYAGAQNTYSLTVTTVGTTTGATYYSLTPARILDTRDGTGLAGKFTSAVPRSLAVTGHGGVPATAIAVTGNLTVTGQSSPGFAALTTVSTPAPTTSTLNFPLGDNRANGVTAPLGAGGVLWMTYMGQVGGATTDLIFDVTGYFLPDASGATYYSLTPARILDTRDGTGLAGKFTSAVPRSLAVTGHGGVPATAIAVTGNLTVTGQSSPGFAALTTVSTPAPTTSTLNFPLGDNRANGVTAPLGAGGVLWMTYMGQVGGATTDLIFDVTGYFLPDASGATYYSLTPARILDTRDGTGLAGKFTSAVPRSLAVTGHGGVPATAIAVTGNLTVTGQSSPGFAALTTVSTPAPTTSTLNFPLGDNRANGVTAPLGAGGVLWMTYMGQVGGATTDLIFDVTGYFLP